MGAPTPSVEGGLEVLRTFTTSPAPWGKWREQDGIDPARLPDGGPTDVLIPERYDIRTHPAPHSGTPLAAVSSQRSELAAR